MKFLRRVILFVLLSIPLAGAAPDAADKTYERVLRLADGKVIPFEEMIDEIRKTGPELVFIGETHDNLRHHRAQLQIIRSFHESKVPTAIGLEMMRANSQKELDEWVAGRMSRREFADVYYDNWKMPWPWYMNIFLYAREKDIPMIGMNLPSRITEKVAHQGFASLTPEELRELPPGISCDIDTQYMEYIKRVYEVHEGKNSSFRHFCEAQMLWDKTMAWHLMSFLKKNPGKTVFVLAGTGHAWKQGIPDQIRKQSKYRFRVILPEIPVRLREETTIDDADYILLD